MRKENFTCSIFFYSYQALVKMEVHVLMALEVTAVAVSVALQVITARKILMSVHQTHVLMAPPVQTMLTLTHVHVGQGTAACIVKSMIMTAQGGKTFS